MYYHTRLTINRSEENSCSEDGMKLAADGLFRQTFEIRTDTFEEALECVSRITHRYRPCKTIELYTGLKKGEIDNVRADDCF